MENRYKPTILVPLAVLTIATLAGTMCCVVSGEYRFWTTAEGRQSDVKLELVDQSDERVKLRRQDNGKVVELPLERLSKDDQAYLRDLASRPRTDVAASSESEHNWPRFRGPGGLGVSSETGLVTEWNATKNILWKAPLPGPGASSPIVWENHVYVTCYSGYGLTRETPGDMSQLQRHLFCLDRSTGSVVWEIAEPASVEQPPYQDVLALHGYASNTPVADESGVYVFFGSSGLFAYNHAGELRWRKACGEKTNNYGSASSPILFLDLVIIHAEVESQSLIAFDKGSGEERWRLSKDSPADTWCTPIVAEANGHNELIYSSLGGVLTGIDVTDGAKLWDCQTDGGRINGSPVAFDGHIGVICRQGKSSVIRLGGSGDVSATHKQWDLNKGAYITSPVYHDGHLYWSRDGGIVYCVNAESGALVYEERLNSDSIYASPVIADSKLYYVSREYGTFVLPARPEFEILAQNRIDSDKSVFNGSPAISGKRIFLRSDRFVYCIGLSHDLGRSSDATRRSATATVSINSSRPANESHSWHQWRGPDRNGVSTEAGLLDRWPTDGPPLAWRVRGMGSGMSSVSIFGERLYTMGHKQGRCHIICRQLSDGSEVWSTPIGGNEPNCTPTVDPESGLVFGLTHDGDLACVEAHSGREVWRKNVGRDFGGKMMSGWGYSESPLVDGDLLICTPGAKDAMIVALDKKTGDTMWKSTQPANVGRHGADGAGYSSIVISHGAGVKQYVQLTGRGLISVAANDGRTLWTYNRVANNVANVPTPIVKGDFVFGSTGYGAGAALVKLSKQGQNVRAEEVYFLDGNTLQNHHGGMVLVEDYLYLGHGHNNGFPACVEFATGKIVWGGSTRGAGSGSAAIVCADEHLYFRYEDGTMALIEASPREYNLKSSFQIASNNGKSWPHPVILNGRLYLRDQDELLCYDVRR